jgi:hypothetical protein
MVDLWRSRSMTLLQWLAIAGALAYAFSLYISNLLVWPSNVSVREWWGSELAIRYCQGFVRRGILGEISWRVSGWLGHSSSYVVALSLVMALAAVAVGLWLGWQLVRRCSWRLGLLILAAPAGWPVLMVHGGSLFRKDSLQILLGILLLWLWRDRINGRSMLAAPIAWLSLAFVEVFAVFNHEPFALLILPTLAIAVFWERRNWGRALLCVSPGLMALLLAVWHKGSIAQVSCLRSDLQRLGLLSAAEMPGSAITELARSTPSYVPWDLGYHQLGWSAFYLIAMSLVVVLAYVLVICSCHASVSRSAPFGLSPWWLAIRLWVLQLFVATPLFVATVDYGRMMAMIFCVGLAFLLLFPCRNAVGVVGGRSTLHLGGPAGCLAALELFLLPSHCCTYQPGQIMAWVPYAAASQWKSLFLNVLSGFPS